MLKGKEVAKWFISKNPELASGYIDENTKINKLLYFSNLMYYCVTTHPLVEDEFIAFPNGPVIYSVYRDYRYNGLNRLPDRVIQPDGLEKRILEIVNFIYGNRKTAELVEESHSHSLWRDVKALIPHNPVIDFSKVDKELDSFQNSLYETYSELDFNNLVKEKINNNIYYYFNDTFELTDEWIQVLSEVEEMDEPKFLEVIDGELVMS